MARVGGGGCGLISNRWAISVQIQRCNLAEKLGTSWRDYDGHDV